MAKHDDLIVLERQFWERSGDEEFWEQNFADDGLVVLGPGTMGKEAVLEAQAGADPWEEYDLVDLETIDMSDDVVSSCTGHEPVAPATKTSTRR
jgi:hypothetical protein